MIQPLIRTALHLSGAVCNTLKDLCNMEDEYVIFGNVCVTSFSGNFE